LTGGKCAAPVAKKILERALPLLGIPSEEEEKKGR
jgi:hypothetical protein